MIGDKISDAKEKRKADIRKMYVCFFDENFSALY